MLSVVGVDSRRLLVPRLVVLMEQLEHGPAYSEADYYASIRCRLIPIDNRLLAYQ